MPIMIETEKGYTEWNIGDPIPSELLEVDGGTLDATGPELLLLLRAMQATRG